MTRSSKARLIRWAFCSGALTPDAPPSKVARFIRYYMDHKQ